MRVFYRPTMTQPTPSAKFRVYAICLLVGLLIGLIPAGIQLIRVQRERDALSQQMRLANLENRLASAAVLARHGDYTAARDAASRFYTEARAELDSADSTLTPAARTWLQSALAERDALITLLARGDPAGAERMTTMYVAYRGASPPR